MKPKLFATKICPYAQRCEIVLLEKRVDHDLEYVGPNGYPADFEKLSPLKKVPVLLTAAGPIIDSVAINEYIEDVYPHPMLPDDAHRRGVARSWIEFCSACMSEFTSMILARGRSEFENSVAALRERLDFVEKHCRDAWATEDQPLSLVDCTYAPLLQRMNFLHDLTGAVEDVARHRSIHNWWSRLRGRPSVEGSSAPDAMKLFGDFLQQRDSYVMGLRGGTTSGGLV